MAIDRAGRNNYAKLVVVVFEIAVPGDASIVLCIDGTTVGEGQALH